jgi:hypothetical protein
MQVAALCAVKRGAGRLFGGLVLRNGCPLCEAANVGEELEPCKRVAGAEAPPGHGFSTECVRNYPTMARDLVWLENDTFAAWGCEECRWIIPGRRVSGKPPLEVKEAFDKHECAKFPAYPTKQERKPKNTDQ